MSQHKRSEHRLGNELKQSAEKIKKSAENQLHKIQGEGHTKRSPREVQARRRKAWFIVGTIFAVLLLTIMQSKKPLSQPSSVPQAVAGQSLLDVMSLAVVTVN